MYDPPKGATFPHSVCLLKNHNSFKACDLKGAKMVANTMQGSGKGFGIVLRQRKHYYFACGERGGFHCSAGLMKFFVRPLMPPCDVWETILPTCTSLLLLMSTRFLVLYVVLLNGIGRSLFSSILFVDNNRGGLFWIYVKGKFYKILHLPTKILFFT